MIVCIVILASINVFLIGFSVACYVQFRKNAKKAWNSERRAREAAKSLKAEKDMLLEIQRELLASNSNIEAERARLKSENAKLRLQLELYQKWYDKK